MKRSPPATGVPARPFARLPTLLLIAIVALGWGLRNHRLLDPDEGRNAEIAREMAATNDYLVPHLDGLPYLDKPVVYFAAAAAAMELLGPTELAARLPAFLFTLGSIALVVWWARRRWGADAGWIAGIAFASMPLVLAYAQETIFDSTLAFFLTGAILAFVEERPVLAWAAIGAGAITKGPVAIAVPLVVMVPWHLLTGRPLRRLVPIAGLAVFALVALPWFLAVTSRLPEFPHYAFVRETFERVTTKGFHRTAPVWYYLPILLIGGFPWIVPALARLRRWRWAWLAREVNPGAQESLLLACWVLGPLLMFSLNQSKLPHYVLPLMPALALAAARALTGDGVGIAWRVYTAVATALGVGLATITLWLPKPISLTPAERAAVPGAALSLGLVLVASALVVAIAVRRGKSSWIIAAYAAVVVAIPIAGGPLLAAVGDDRSSAAVTQVTAAVLARESAAGAPAEVLGIGAYIPSLPFYLRRTVPIATVAGRELTSNYIADYVEQYRTSAGTPLRPADEWRLVLAHCATPTVFIARAGDRETRTALAARLPLLAEDARFSAYGPCAAPAAARPDRGR
ncbi:MAG TPA: glycosyltransferase family 39 protein [Gemmatimonadales bacterium]|nr:glycosyltransferase family 39 protein [Gemmatimonadales bacterium]